MIEIDLNPSFDGRVLTAKRNLADIINSSEKTVATRARTSPGATPKDIVACEEIITNFLGAYLAIVEEVEKREIFHRESKNSYLEFIRMYGLYTSSKAVLNKINDEAVEKIRGYEMAPSRTSITFSDLNKPSDYEMLEQILTKLSRVKKRNNVDSLKYAYFTFFNRIREMAKNHLGTCHSETIKDLSRIQIYKTGLDFHEIPPPQKREFAEENEKATAATSQLEQLPTELPSYETQRHPSLDTVIGNNKALEVLHAAVIRVLKYDAEQKRNPFFPFQDAFILYGDPGTGKNFTIDALLNYVRESAQVYGEKVEFVKLGHGIKSIYKDRPAQIFERYISLENEGDKIYINILDEADSIFPVNAKGEMHEETKKLIGEMKTAINNSDKGNALYILMTNYAEQFEAALKQRFTSVEMPGPSTPEDFAQLLTQELGMSRNGLAKEELLELGAKLHQYKRALAPPILEKEASDNGYIPITGRDVKKLVAPFVSGNNKIIIANEDTIRKASYKQMLQLLPQLQADLSFEKLDRAIDAHVTDLQKSIAQTTGRYNR